MKKNNDRKINGFALLTSIISTSILLLISFAVVNLTLKEVLLTYAGQESQYSFYNADNGVECAMYWDLKNPGGKSAFDPNSPGVISCNGTTVYTGSQTVPTIPSQQSIIGGNGGNNPSSQSYVKSSAGVYSWKVPSDTTTITVKVWGAGGGSGQGKLSDGALGGLGGGGGYSQGTVSVTPNETLTVYVGGGGQAYGTETSFAGSGGAGGGYSALKRGSDLLLLAAGGGGGGGRGSGSNQAGGAGGAGGGLIGNDGVDGMAPFATKGTGGNQSAGGSGGSSSGTDGSSLQGGTGGNGFGPAGGTNGGGQGGTATSKGGGGGGGGGYFGGGGGGYNSLGYQGAGGGGGSSYIVSGAIGTAIASGFGSAAGNNSDTDYISGHGVGGQNSSGGDGIVVINYSNSPPQPVTSIFMVPYTHGCAIVWVAKSGTDTTITSRGYNTCDTSNPKRFERGITITY